MADPFVAEIRMFPFNFAPTGWAACNGQILPISQNTALFSLIGTFYGGDGRSNFALPNLQASTPMHQGQGPGLTSRVVGETGGEETVTLLSSQLPAHAHTMSATSAGATSSDPTPVNNVPMALSTTTAGVNMYRAGTNPITTASVAASGGSQPHNNRQPYLVVNFCIALQGIFPPRS
jgi:microcystin-dependent protein